MKFRSIVAVMLSCLIFTPAQALAEAPTKTHQSAVSDRVEAHQLAILRHKTSLAHIKAKKMREHPPKKKPVQTAARWPWSVVCVHESGCNWSINTGNGYYGGLQFLVSTWNHLGCAEFAPRPDLATMLEQEACADRMPQNMRRGAWPNTYPG